ncbi:hypothetical protein ACN4EK_31155 [Pantanalinema rosaneae CENA516]|uniref:hypothetical protein n=1 Tax=Pantanalinema rosaneae TaxID=1620701 RepID=UPI003D6FE5FD
MSLLVGSLGIQAVMVSRWLWQQQQLEAQQQEEEETLTPYESQDNQALEAHSNRLPPPQPPRNPRLAGWEFKIVRAHRDVFRDPTVFKQLCDEESQSGWILLEKLDDRRVRFKRPIALRDLVNSELLPIDPYRSHYGSTSNWGTLIWAIALLTAIILPAYLGYALVSLTLSRIQSGPAASTQPSTAPTPSPDRPASPTPSNLPETSGVPE